MLSAEAGRRTAVRRRYRHRREPACERSRLGTPPVPVASLAKRQQSAQFSLSQPFNFTIVATMRANLSGDSRCVARHRAACSRVSVVRAAAAARPGGGRRGRRAWRPVQRILSRWPGGGRACNRRSPATAPAVADSKRVPFGQEEMQLSFAPLVKNTAPAVVNVYACSRCARSPSRAIRSSSSSSAISRCRSACSSRSAPA